MTLTRGARLATRKKSKADDRMGDATPNTDRLPPDDPGAEQAVLGAILMSNGACVPQCQLSITPEHFFDLSRRIIYGHAMACFEKDRMVDLVSLNQALKDTGELEAVSPQELLSACMDVCVSVANLPVWLEALCAKWRARRAINIGSTLVATVYNNPAEVDAALASADVELMDLISGQSNVSSHSSGAIAAAALNEVERRHQLGGKLSGIATGWWDLDTMTNGLQRGQQTILGARPSVGKSALAGNLIEHVCLRDKIPTLMVSLEMSMEQFMSRMASSYTRVLADRVKTGSLLEGDFPKLASFFAAVKDSPLFFLDCVVKRLTCAEIAASIRIHAETNGVQLVVVDYLQIVRPTKSKQKRTDEVSEISSTLRRTAVATNTTVFALAQLNRDSEKDKPRAPKLTDLRECGQIEQDADCVLLLHRTQSDDEEAGKAFLNVAKQRDGATGLVHLTWLPQFCRFENAAKVSQEDYPQPRPPYAD